ncbi:hypothetical protein [Cecembia lonarensis]|uniref:hypothetical protein n=1 Tax=Cecembia lonarensis TaxID=645110 RepID=UPI0002E6EBDB|nr:hypothetical protein [Cecembia lonarensis]
MKRKIFVCCSFLPVKSFLEQRFGNNHYFLERHAGLIQPEEDLAMIEELLQTGNFDELIFTIDLDCIFFQEIISQKNDLDFPQKDFLKHIFRKNFTEIQKETKFSSKVAALYLAYLEEISFTLSKEMYFLESIYGDQLHLKGMLTQVRKEKSIEFNINLATQAL